MADYRYNSKDADLSTFKTMFRNGLGDESQGHDAEFFDTLKLIMSLKKGTTLIDIGCGLGRVLAHAIEPMESIVALEPDANRWQAAADAYHKPPHCEVLNVTSTDYLEQHPNATFDVVVLSMVMQHLPTTAYERLLKDISLLLKPDGAALISTTHALDQVKGFSYQKADPDELYIDRDTFDAYAGNISQQSKGIPVRRFSKQEFTECVSDHLDIALWRQYSYYNSKGLEFFARRYSLPQEALENVGNSQFVVAMKKG